jgi:hypothetical protein
MNTTIGTRPALGPDRVADVSHAGETFAATTTAPIFDASGRARVPPGAVVQGRVAVLKPGVGLRSPQLELAAERLDGRALKAHVVTNDVQQLPSTDLGASADSAAFAGALLGGIAFGIPGVVIGYAWGGGDAAVGVVRERRVEAWLSAGDLITVELEEPLTIAASAATAAR